MKSFIQETAEDIVNQFGDELSEIEIIFPNKRTDFHFKKSLAQILQKTSWSPKTYTIQQYIGQLTGLRSIDKISLLFELFDSFKQIDKNFNYDFDAFLKLGEIILNDFNEIDSYLVEAKQIFTNIKNLHEIDVKYSSLTEEQQNIIKQYWKNFSIEDKSKEKELFLQLWNILPDVYKHFSDKLLTRNHAYEGLIYKHLADSLIQNQLNESDNIKLFIGFNALNKAQKTLFKYLKKKNKAFFYWDNDSYYHHNPVQEAGDFLRINYQVLEEDDSKIPGNFKSLQKKITIIGIPGNIGQAKAIPCILKEWCNKQLKLEHPEKTVVVLPDENMLFPVLHSIPDYIGSLNITMGYPLKNTGLYSLLIYFLKVQNSINNSAGSKIKIYHKDVLAILNHPFIKPVYPELTTELINEIVARQMVYVSNDVLVKEGFLLFESIFTPVASKNASDLPAKMLNLLFILFTNTQGKQLQQNSIENEYIYHTYLEVKRLYETLQQESIKNQLSFITVIQFIKQLLGGLRIPFESESTDGLQIMGLIETRNIDFENVILLNANEGILPKLGRPPSLISESMHHAFDLPVLKYQDAIFAYFYYRLLQRAKNIYILYDNLGSNNRSGEISRFIYQLELESGFEITRLQLNQQLRLIPNKTILIRKSEFVLNQLNEFIVNAEHSKKHLTATSIDTYLNCSFQFYLKYIARIKEPDKVEEDFSPVEMGIIVHLVMELLYKDLIISKGTKKIDKDDFEELNNKLEACLEKAFKTHLEIAEENRFEFTGNMLIIKEVITKYLVYILKFDEKRAPFEILQLEDTDSFKTSVQIEIDDKKLVIGIKGVIDRIDMQGENLHIIDYKTGKADKVYTQLSELFNRDSLKRKKALLQLFLYGLLVKNKPDFSKYQLIPGIYDIKNMYDKDFNPFIQIKIDGNEFDLKHSIYEDLLNNFEEELSHLLAEVFNPDIPFSQTEFEDNCNYCSYRAICGKE